jgi:ABC-2 type transport system permease protein
VRRELRAEWTKLRTTPGAGWLLAAIVALTAGAGAAADAVVTGAYDVPKLALVGVQPGQAAVAVLGITMIGGEYGTGMIRTTLAAMPRRTVVLAAKATVLTGVTLAAGTVAVLASMLSGWLILPGHTLSLADGPTLRAATGSILYLALIALFSLGAGVMARDATVAAGIALGIPFLLSIMTIAVPDLDWARFFYRISPMNAGLTIQATADLAHLPMAPWAGLGVTAAWATVALAAGGLLLKMRDA